MIDLAAELAARRMSAHICMFPKDVQIYVTGWHGRHVGTSRIGYSPDIFNVIGGEVKRLIEEAIDDPPPT